MHNDWQKIWNNREDRLTEIDSNDAESIFMELKRLNGYDLSSGISYSAFIKELDKLKSKLGGGGQIFEVGCGSGANLYKFHRDGFKVGGLDYSQTLVDAIKKVLHPEEIIECLCTEAINLPIEIQYDSVISLGVFDYFPSLEYARNVLEKMSLKSRKSILIQTLNDETREEYFKFHRKAKPNYDDLYKDLPKQFYPRRFFEDFAKEHGFSIEFEPSTLEGYWNNDFIFHCYIYKN